MDKMALLNVNTIENSMSLFTVTFESSSDDEEEVHEKKVQAPPKGAKRGRGVKPKRKAQAPRGRGSKIRKVSSKAQQHKKPASSDGSNGTLNKSEIDQNQTDEHTIVDETNITEEETEDEKSEPVVISKTILKSSPTKETPKPLTEEEQVEAFIQNAHKKSQSHNLQQYKMTWERSLIGRQGTFKLIGPDGLLYQSVIKGRSIETIDIQNETGKQIGSIIINPDLTSFSLRKDTMYGNELITITFSKRSNHMPRSAKLFMFNVIDGIPQILYSRQPKLVADTNVWIINLHGRTATRSIKNSILIDPTDNHEFIVFLKLGKTEFNVEIDPRIDPMYGFAFGIAAIYCKLK